MFKILVSDSLPTEILEKYNGTEGIEVVNKIGISMDDLKNEIADYDGLVIRSRTKVKADILAAATNLKVIGRAGAGVDNVDTEEATKRGIIVMNTPGGNTMAATEHTIAMMLAGLRNIAPANASMLDGKWDRKTYIGNEIYQKTIGVVGLGKIGQEVAKRLAAFDAKLIGYDPVITSETAARLGVKLVDLNELMEQSDIITIHAPKMPETINMINAQNLKLCKDGVIFVNCARGGIINEKDLMGALDDGKVELACVDVFSSEPPEDFDLAQHPKVLATPHLGASTEEAQTKVADQILDQMIEFFQKNVARNAVNFVSVDEDVQEYIAPFFKLAEKLGSVFNQIKTSRLKEISVRYYGNVLEVPVEPITSYLLVGALKPSNDEKDVANVNPVNALTVAREGGVSIEIAKKDTPLTVHTNAIACDFITEEGTIHLAGSFVGLNIFHLIEYDDFKLSAELADQLLIVENDNVPGIIGKVGTILGEENVNISHMSSGRDGDKNTALNVFNTKETVNKELLIKLQNITGVNKVYLSKID
ncbi:MAG: phosphoglycerate dehydrogenase [Calditrichaeota bacterium]|nr:MAG: phosphoglycerate dehydrogenase [Calditrichota bacterium]MBL1206573.1 phosphoglycerate dehydrogenase [Calditrichota bacterium]NOG46400.1 phosphoglycerate dehydrogenase [Calditrichota bacterium]